MCERLTSFPFFYSVKIVLFAFNGGSSTDVLQTRPRQELGLICHCRNDGSAAVAKHELQQFSLSDCCFAVSFGKFCIVSENLYI